jgi:hypothetical protein
MFISKVKRLLSTQSNAPFTVPEKVIIQRVGAFKGGLVGFLAGFSCSSALGYIYLLEEYQLSSNTLLGNVEDLQTSTSKVLLFNPVTRLY